MPPVLEAQALVIARGRRIVLSGIDLALAAGEAACVEGPNGSGKTSLLRVLAGLTAPRAGTVARRTSCAFVPEKVALSPAMRCREWLRAMRSLRGLGGLDWAGALQAGGLEASVLDAPCSTLSKGMLQRLALLEALHDESALLLMDEPFSGLDADGRDWLARALRAAITAGRGAVVTDHSGAARSALPGSMLLRLGGAVRERTVTIVATRPGGERIERRAPAEHSDALLRELLDDGWHVDEVRP